jgi:hypothetical protein
MPRRPTHSAHHVKRARLTAGLKTPTPEQQKREIPMRKLSQLKAFAPGDEDRQRQDFLAGTVFAAGAGIIGAAPSPGQTAPVDPVFVVFVHDDERTYGPAPQLREAFAMLDQVGAIETNEKLHVATAWSAHVGKVPLVKLKLEFEAPLTGKTGLVLVADQYAELWQHIMGGGMVAVTTQERLHKATAKPNADVSDALEASICLGIDRSAVLSVLCDSYDWPKV